MSNNLHNILHHLPLDVQLVGSEDWAIAQGDSALVLRELPSNSFDSSIGDPPGGGNHLAQKWDGPKGGMWRWIIWLAVIYRQVYRVLKPGGYAFVWCWRNTSHWTGMALELSGFRMVVECNHYHAGGCTNGNLDVAKSVESLLLFGDASNKNWKRLTGERRGGTPTHYGTNEIGYRSGYRATLVNHQGAFTLDPQTPEGAQWMGWGTMIPTTGDPWWLVQKPLSEPTVAANVLRWGTGALNIGAYRDRFGVWPGNVHEAPKALVSEKEAGCEKLPPIIRHIANPGGLRDSEERFKSQKRRNSHPTVKSLDHMETLIELTTRPGGLTLDPFLGSGTTVAAARRNGRWQAFGVEQKHRHFLEAQARIRYWEAFEEAPKEAPDAHPDQLSIFSLEGVA